MPHVVLTPEQLRVVREANGPVDVRDQDGRPVASMRLLTPEDLQAIDHYLRTRGQKRQTMPFSRVRAFLRKLHQIDEREGINRDKVQELLRRLRAGGEI
jgi:hypothetical protein